LRAYIILDLGFGDAGKGLLTDFLARHLKTGLVVRYNGGAQAGHHVISPDGRQHTFSQFGSGTFIPHVKTYLSKYVVLDPLALLVEGEALESKGVRDAFTRLRMSDQALVITPFQRAANRMRELARGENRHGSCGIGVGETYEDALTHSEICIRAGDLKHPGSLRRKTRAIRDLKRDQIITFCKDHSYNPTTAREFEALEGDDLIDSWIRAIARIGELGLVTPDSVLEGWLRETDNVIFEGAQGVLLDAEAGFHPHTTWSNCTAENAMELINQAAPGAQVHRIGVTRSYAVRHGAGPLPTETGSLAPLVSEHNQHNQWQGAVRYGWFDGVLTRYALSVAGGVDSLAVTHMDLLPRLERWKYCPGYRDPHLPGNTGIVSRISDGLLTGFRLPPGLSIAKRAGFTRALSNIMPVFNDCSPDEEAVIGDIEELSGQKIGMLSYGPRAENVRIVNPLP